MAFLWHIAYIAFFLFYLLQDHIYQRKQMDDVNKGFQGFRAKVQTSHHE